MTHLHTILLAASIALAGTPAAMAGPTVVEIRIDGILIMDSDGNLSIELSPPGVRPQGLYDGGNTKVDIPTWISVRTPSGEKQTYFKYGDGWFKLVGVLRGVPIGVPASGSIQVSGGQFVR